MATAPTPGARRQEEAEAAVITVKLDGEVHRLRIGEMSALDVGALRRATGLRTRELIRLGIQAPDIDVGATMIWLARRQNGEPRLDYETAVSQLTYVNELSIGDDEPEPEDDDSPEG